MPFPLAVGTSMYTCNGYMYTCMFVHEYNKDTAPSYLTFLPTFNTCQLPKGHTSLQQHLDGKALVSRGGTCWDARAPQTYHLLAWV